MITEDTTLPTTVNDAERHGWRSFGNLGSSRYVFVHPDRPGRVLKIDKRGWDGNAEAGGCADEVRIYSELQGTALANWLTPIVSCSPCERAVLMVEETYTFSLGEMFGPELMSPSFRSQARAMMIPDTHAENLAGIVDDYGNVVPSRILDYAFPPENYGWC